MKRLFDFVFAEGEITPQNVWYLVPVGQSVADQRAASYVRSYVRNDSRFFFQKHDTQVARYIDRVSASVGCRVRRHVVGVRSLATFLRHCPPVLLNSPWVPCVNIDRLMSGTSVYRVPKTRANDIALTSHVKNLSSHA